MASSSSVLTETHRLVAPGRVITELTRGREIADRLRLLLRETTESADSVFPAQSLVTQLLDTFTHSLTMLRDSDDVSQAPSTAAAAKSEDSGDSCKTPPPAKDRRGCYKRKRNAETVVKESPNMVEDGHAWRKYGQKVILNAKHPRNYFRCTHKYEQGCQATKQVQRVQDNPPLYRTTYSGHHTCNANANANTNNIIISSNISSPPHSSSQVIWTFNSTTTTTATTINPVKQEEIHNNNDSSCNKVEIKSSSSSSSRSRADDCYMAALDYHHHHHLNLGDISSDVYSCSASATTHDDDHISIEDYFQF